MGFPGTSGFAGSKSASEIYFVIASTTLKVRKGVNNRTEKCTHLPI